MRASKPKTSFVQPQLSIDSNNHKPTTTITCSETVHPSQGTSSIHNSGRGLGVMSNIDRSHRGEIASSQQFISTRQMMQATKQQPLEQSQASRQGNQGEQEIPET